MNRYLFPEQDICDKCHKHGKGVMLYINDIPISFCCLTCYPNPKLNILNKLIVDEEKMMNGWEWSKIVH